MYIMARNKFPYIVSCREMLADIDIAAFREARLKECLAVGSSYAMFTTGSLISTGIFMGVKMQRRAQSSPTNRFIEEIGTMQALAAANKELLRALPRVFGLIVVDDSYIRGLLVEDVSADNTHDVTGREMSEDFKKQIEANVDPSLLIGDYRDYMAFDADGHERILDAEPSPFISAPDIAVQARAEVSARLNDFSISVPPNCPLGLSLQSPPWS